MVRNNAVEEVDNLTLDEITTYFKALNLSKDNDVPFVATVMNGGRKLYIFGTFDESKNKISNTKVILPKQVDGRLDSLMKDSNFVVLS